jgi:GNAT superfamily N-acetyltransferase
MNEHRTLRGDRDGAGRYAIRLSGHLDARCGVVELDGQVAGSGGILFHYNRPYGDIYMDVAEPFRRRGAGSFLVQELKRVCYEGGHVPAARCNPANIASRRTLQKAGFVPCGHILTGSVRIDPATRG